MTDYVGRTSSDLGHVQPFGEFDTKLSKQLMDHTQRILKEIETTRSSIVEEIVARSDLLRGGSFETAGHLLGNAEHGPRTKAKAGKSTSTFVSCIDKDPDASPRSPPETAVFPEQGLRLKTTAAKSTSTFIPCVEKDPDASQRNLPEVGYLHQLRTTFAPCEAVETGQQRGDGHDGFGIMVRRFDLCVAFVITLNFVFIFVEIEMERADMANHLGLANDIDPHQRDERMLVFEILELSFTAIFVLELLIRLAVYRLSFFRSPFNVVDAVIVIWTSLHLHVLQPLSSYAVNLSYLRLFRACRVVWALRTIRTAQIFENLRVLIRTIIASVSVLLWSMAGLGLIMVLASIVLSQSLHTFLLSPVEDKESQKKIFDLYGSSSRSFYTLVFVTFADDWQAYVKPLENEVNTLYSFFFLVYIVFVRFSMLNVINGLFVKNALHIAEHDSLMMYRMQSKTKNQLVSLLEAQDTAGSGCVSLAQLQNLLGDPAIRSCISSFDLSIDEVESLFSLMQDGNGLVKYRDFVDSMMRVKGRMRALDGITVLRRTRHIQDFSKSILEVCRQCKQMEERVDLRTKVTYKRQHEIRSTVDKLNTVLTRGSGCPHCTSVQRKNKKRALLTRLRIFMVILKQKTTKLGQTLLCKTYQDYLFYRGTLMNEEYKIELESDHEAWAVMFERYRKALLALPSSRNWDKIYWIGSSAVPDLVAKPVLDMMITTTESDLKEIVHNICLEANDESWLAEKGAGMKFPIGFCMEDWGFLQMPHFQASLHGLLECNIHILRSGSTPAHEKIILVEFLKSPEGKEFKDKYSILKLSLEMRFRAGQLTSANYNKEKNFLVADIIKAASDWDAARDQESHGGMPWTVMKETNVAPVRGSIETPLLTECEKP